MGHLFFMCVHVPKVIFEIWFSVVSIGMADSDGHNLTAHP